MKTFHFKTEDNESTIEGLVQKLPELILDPSIVGTYYLSKEVSKYTKNLLFQVTEQMSFWGVYMAQVIFNTKIFKYFNKTISLQARFKLLIKFLKII